MRAQLSGSLNSPTTSCRCKGFQMRDVTPSPQHDVRSRAIVLASAFLLLACSGCGASSSLPTGAMDPADVADADADGGATPEVVYLLPSSATGVSTGPLLAGVTYSVVVQGDLPPVWWTPEKARECARSDP
jgi:hypothetical protein